MERHLMYQANSRSLLALHIATMDMNKVIYTLQYCLYQRQFKNNLNGCKKMESINRLYIHMMKCYIAVTMNELEAYESTQIFEMLTGKKNEKILHSV